jgi:flagellar FliL protein
MAKDKSDSESEVAQIEGPKKSGLVGKITGLLFGSKMKMMITGGALLVLLLGGGAAYYFLFTGSDDAVPGDQTAEADLPIIAPTVAFMDIPDLIVNIQSADGTPAYLKLGVSLEIANAEQKPGLQAVMPRVVDQFQSYLRELRIDDLKGSAGVLRLKEELLRRINVAATPYKIRDVLLKEMIVQ